MTRPAISRRSRWPRPALAGLACLLVLATAPALARAGQPDQSQTAPTTGTASFGGAGARAQTFTAGLTGRLDQVDLLLVRAGSPGDLTVQIRNTSGGAPGATVLASETVSQADIPEGGFRWVSVAFDPTASSIAGTQYAIVLIAGTGSGAYDPNNDYGWSASDGDPYTAGDVHSSGDGGASWFEAPADAAFRTYVAPADTTAPASTATPSPEGTARIAVTATATFKTTTGATVGSVGPVRCFNTRGIRVALNASDAGSGVASLTYQASGAQPIAPTTTSALPATVTITARGKTTLTHAATDNAGNTEQPNSHTVIVGSGFACATPTPNRFTIPTHGTATIKGSATIGGITIPFNTTITY